MKTCQLFLKLITNSKFKNLGKCFLQMREIVSESCCTMCNKTWPGSGCSVRNLTRHSSSSPYRYSHTYQCTKKVKKNNIFFHIELIKFLFRIYPFLLLTLLFVFLLVLQFKQITKLIEHIKNDRYVDFLYVSIGKEKNRLIGETNWIFGFKKNEKICLLMCPISHFCPVNHQK